MISVVQYSIVQQVRNDTYFAISINVCSTSLSEFCHLYELKIAISSELCPYFSYDYLKNIYIRIEQTVLDLASTT